MYFVISFVVTTVEISPFVKLCVILLLYRLDLSVKRNTIRKVAKPAHQRRDVYSNSIRFVKLNISYGHLPKGNVHAHALAVVLPDPILLCTINGKTAVIVYDFLYGTIYKLIETIDLLPH